MLEENPARKNQEPFSGQPILVYPQVMSPQDEISLIDIVKTIIKQKNIIFVSLFVFFCIGLSQYFLSEELYNYSTTIRLGTKLNILPTTKTTIMTNIEPIRSIEQVKTKLDSNYIPVVLASYLKANKNNKKIQISSKINKKTNQVILISVARLGTDEIIGLHNKVSELIITDELPLLNKAKSILNLELKIIKQELERLYDSNYLSYSKIKILNEIKLLESDTINIKNNLKAITKELDKFSLNEELKKAELLLIDKQLSEFNEINKDLLSQSLKDDVLLQVKVSILIEIEKLNAKKIFLKHYIQVILPVEYQNIQNTRDRAILEQKQKKNQITLLEAKLNEYDIQEKQNITQKQTELEYLNYGLLNIQPTQILMETQQSVSPENRKKNKYLILSVVLGLFFGLFGVFIAEFLAKLKKPKC